VIAFAGIDLGGTKSEAQLFDDNWNVVDRQRVSTPEDYETLVDVVVTQVQWALEQAGRSIPVGIGAPGMIDANGNAFTANLPAKGKPLPADIAKAAGHQITYVNDCRSLALSEAAFGAGQGHRTVMSLIIGTGVGGGVVFDGHLRPGPSSCGGEFGHMTAGAASVQQHGLHLYQCGCGRIGCAETFVAGPGLVRMAKDLTGKDMTTQDIGKLKDQAGDACDVWQVWLDVTADLLLSLIQSIDPNIITLGGGLSQIPNVANDLKSRVQEKHISGFGLPEIVVAAGGDASGARGAALAAAQEAGYV
jgi:N-acetylglucosamine kinase